MFFGEWFIHLWIYLDIPNCWAYTAISRFHFQKHSFSHITPCFKTFRGSRLPGAAICILFFSYYDKCDRWWMLLIWASPFTSTAVPRTVSKCQCAGCNCPHFSSTQEGVSGHVSENDILNVLQYISKVNYSQTQCFTHNILAACLKMIHGRDQDTTAQT